MFLVGMLSWWYSGGWKHRLQGAARRMKNVAAFFSIGQLLRTLFSPFRQISASNVSGAVNVQLRAFFDKLISRVIGSIVRTMTIIFGIVALCLTALFQFILLIVWLVLPLAPIVGLILTIIGWTPSW